MTDLDDRDREQLAAAGISPAEAARQLELLRHPPAAAALDRPCRVGDGIVQLEEGDYAELAGRFERAAERGRVVRFVPASGAATRMFRRLSAVTAGGGALTREALAVRASGGDQDAEAALDLCTQLPDLAFYDELAAAMAAAGDDLDRRRQRGELGPILDRLLGAAGDGGLALADRPKALVPFHRYPPGEGGPRTALEEHLAEAVLYAADRRGRCRNHFTLQPDHLEAFLDVLGTTDLGRRLQAYFETTFSYQAPATDTLAIDPDGAPFRDDDGRLLLRPGGHGALIDNLGRLYAISGGADLAVIKNIDNVVPGTGRTLAAHWKKLLGGKLLALQERVFALLERLETETGKGLDTALDEAAALAAELGRTPPAGEEAAAPEERRRALIERLDRPLRVCGVVFNRGEPGGGPFWVRGPGGETTPQIVEASQIDRDDPEQRRALEAATHFNPVDLVCTLCDRHGRPYDLGDFVDPDAVFVAAKSHAGRPLRALERPGLWNGAMAGWNTLFVEVPEATFAPVKTVLDLLRPAHRTGVPPAALAG